MKKQQALFYTSIDKDETKKQFVSSSPAPSVQPWTLTQWLQLQAGYSGIVDKYFNIQIRACLGSTCRAGRYSQKYPETQCQDFLDRLKERVELDRELLTTAVRADLEKKKEELNQMLQSLFKRKINWVRYLAQLPVPVNLTNYNMISFYRRWLIDMMAGISLAFMHLKIQGLTHGQYGYTRNPAVQSASLGPLVKEGNLDAIDRKINWLTGGQGGSEGNSAGACPINEPLVEKEDLTAIMRKIRGLAMGCYGYEKNPAAARAIIDELVGKGDSHAMFVKIFGLSMGRYGYEKNPAAACAMNDGLVEKGDPGAINRKIDGLSGGRCGYEKNPAAARALIDELVEKGTPGAIDRKIQGLVCGGDGYKKNLKEARDLYFQILMKRGDPIAKVFLESDFVSPGVTASSSSSSSLSDSGSDSETSTIKKRRKD